MTKRASTLHRKVVIKAAEEAEASTATSDIPVLRKPSTTPERKRKPLLAPSKFQPRSSRLDLETLDKEKSEFRGWVNFVGLSVCAYLIFTSVHNWSFLGQFFTLRLYRSVILDTPTLLLADLGMVTLCFGAFILQKLIVARAIAPRMELILQHLFQSCLFVYCLSFIWLRDFPWLQSASFLMHTIVMFMKVHSYLSTNRELAYQVALRASKISGSGDDWGTSDEEMYKKNKVLYPHNVTLRNFVYYLLVPTLVYETEYPQTDRIRPMYILEKVIAFLGTFWLLYISVEHYIMPVLDNMKTMSPFETLIALLLPFMLCYIAMFYMIFELICNIVAELTYFADRQFYQDWWNSVTFDEYARKWNKPVHEFLLRHVYLESIHKYKVGKTWATFLTFFFSSVLHELVMVVVVKKVLFYLFFLQLFQLPLIYLGRMQFVRDRPRMGNIFFWIGLFWGPPMLCIAYLRDFYVTEGGKRD